MTTSTYDPHIYHATGTRYLVALDRANLSRDQRVAQYDELLARARAGDVEAATWFGRHTSIGPHCGHRSAPRKVWGYTERKVLVCERALAHDGPHRVYDFKGQVADEWEADHRP